MYSFQYHLKPEVSHNATLQIGMANKKAMALPDDVQELHDYAG